jgi:hypothetical protein
MVTHEMGFVGYMHLNEMFISRLLKKVIYVDERGLSLTRKRLK